MTRNVMWYHLEIPSPSYTSFAYSPHREKILQLQMKVEEFHSNQGIFQEFESVFKRGNQLNNDLVEILIGLEKIWAEVENNVPLESWCEVGIKGKFETKKTID